MERIVDLTTRHASVSSYGIVASGRDSMGPYVDFFVPELMLKQLELRPGALAIVQGMSPTAREFFLRARSGLANVVGRTPFTAAVRLANKPKVLHRFLTLARQQDIQFQAIRTFGYRADDASEVVFEG